MSTAGRAKRRGNLTGLHAAFSCLVSSGLAQRSFDGVECPPWWFAPPRPDDALKYNGITHLKPACFNHSSNDTRPHSVYIIGDWGGILYGGATVPVPADHRAKKFKKNHRKFVDGADDTAQVKVAIAMKQHAVVDRVDYVLNVGDNFYWGGLDGKCNDAFRNFGPKSKNQWINAYENMYNGPLDNKQWLGVLGNHDFGGWNYLSAWDQNIGYTWGAEGSTWRWFQPALYYKTTAHYEDFTIDYFFVDTNIFDAFDPNQDAMHNICGQKNNPHNKGCTKTGPFNIWQCKWWFINMWRKQVGWLNINLAITTHRKLSDWQIIVTHFPPLWGMDQWKKLCDKFGVDIFIAGHVHSQQLWAQNEWPKNQLGNTAVVISGGGGGITSEDAPNKEGWDDQYGFVKMQVSKEEIILRHISHGAQLRRELRVYQRHPAPPTTTPVPTTHTETTTPEHEEHKKKAQKSSEDEGHDHSKKDDHHHEEHHEHHHKHEHEKVTKERRLEDGHNEGPEEFV